jgi:hypothetical protein
MCNDCGNHVPNDAYVQAFSQLKVPFVSPHLPRIWGRGRTSGQPRSDL